jgi:hypothetical protein
VEIKRKLRTKGDEIKFDIDRTERKIQEERK